MTCWSNAYVVKWNRKIFLRLRNKASCKRLKRLVEFFSNLLCEFLRLACWLDLCRTNSQKYQHKSCTNIFIWAQLNSFILRLIVECDFFCWIYVHQIFPPRNETRSTSCTGGPSSSCEMIILRNNCHGGIIRPLSLMKRTHFSELSISRFFLCTYKTSKWTTR